MATEGAMSRAGVALALTGVLLLLSACSQSSFLGQRWANFTAYYNTFYNAEQAFDEGVRQVDQRDQPIELEVLIDLFGTPESVRDPRPFDEAIEKSADVLRDHSSSRYVDDALMLIGKSYYYLQNYVGAAEKFEEAAALETGRMYEAHYWHVRTLLSARQYERAVAFMEGVLAGEEVPERWRGRYWLALGAGEAYLENYRAAFDALEVGLESVSERRLRARGHFLLGQVAEALGQYSDSKRAFEAAASASSDFELTYAARFNAIRIAGRYGDAREALTEARRMERDGAFFERRGEPAYLAARILKAMDETDAARTSFRELLYERDAPLQNVQGRIHYGLAELYRDAFRDYELAAAHFDTAAAQLRGSRMEGQQRPATPYAILDASIQRDAFVQYAEAYRQVTRADSLLALGSLPDEEFQAFVQDLREQLAAEREEAEREAARQRRGGQGHGLDDEQAAMEELDATPEQEIQEGRGFLSYRDPVRVQDGQVAFVQRWGERPLAPNWRRAQAVQMQQRAQAEEADTIEASETGIAEEVVAQADSDEALPQVDVSDVPRDPESKATMRAEQVRAMYDVGNALFLSLERPEEALDWYQQVVETSTNEDLTLRALYAMAQAHRSMDRHEDARAYDERIVAQFPDSDVAQYVVRLDHTDSDEQQVGDHTADAEAAYHEALERWDQADSQQEAIEEMLLIATAFPETETAPRALFAASRFIVEWHVEQDENPVQPLHHTLSSDVLRLVGLDDPDGEPRAYEAQQLLQQKQARAAFARVEESLFAADLSADLARIGLASGELSVVGTEGESTPSVPFYFAAGLIPQQLIAGEGPNVTAVLRRLVEAYPDTRYSERGGSLLAILSDETEEVPEDPPMVADAEAEDAEDEAPPPAIPGPGDDAAQTDFAWEVGQWAISIVSWDNEQYASRSASTFMDRFADEGFDVAVFVDEDGSEPVYHVGLGPFDSEDDAEAALEDLEGRMPPDATVKRVPPQPEEETDEED